MPGIRPRQISSGGPMIAVGHSAEAGPEPLDGRQLLGGRVSTISVRMVVDEDEARRSPINIWLANSICLRTCGPRNDIIGQHKSHSPAGIRNETNIFDTPAANRFCTGWG